MPASAQLLQDTQSILKALVGFNTVSHDSNLALIEYIEHYLASHGVASQRVNEEPGKASLWARIGPDVPGGVVLSGHTDVVPVEGQTWHTDPFEITEKDGKLYGRGTSDMKSFLAIALACVPTWLKTALPVPIYLCFSHDEEVGCLGATPLAEFIAQSGADPRLMVIGEPTEMRLINAHKGIVSFETIVTGKEAHSSNTHRGVNAVMVMADIVHFLNEIAEECRDKTHNEAFDPPYTTVHVGSMHGGVARNIIPSECRIAWEIRPVPEHDWSDIVTRLEAFCERKQATMREVAPDVGIRTSMLTNVRGLQPSEDEALMRWIMHISQANRQEAVSFGTEAGTFQHHGLEAIICGPGSIDQAHKPNEFIETSQLEAGIAFMERLVSGLLDNNAN
ncbi:MAG: acetylornithine deacetylase [Rickettsiales bacterium]|nr:acetylornithine deacetylase [Rickettsiales bacterium]